MSALQFLLDKIGEMDPEQLLQNAANHATGVVWYSTTAGARTGEEEVPINPLPDQINEDGSDPEETDSDLDAESSASEGRPDDEAEEDVDEDEMEDQDESDFEDTVGTPKASGGRRSKTKATRQSTTPATTRRPQQPKNEALATAIPVKARLPRCDIGAVELLTFFPHHTNWPEVGLRLYRNTWKHPDVARIQLHARGTLDRQAYTKRVDSLKHQILKNGEIFFNVQSFAPTKHGRLMTPVTSYDASNYVARDNVSRILVDASLAKIAEGVVNWPSNADRGIVTQVIEYTHQNGLGQYTTADIPQLAQQMGFTAPGEASGTQWDQNAKRRVDQIAGPVP